MKTIVTHPGVFHADEVMAVAILSLHTQVNVIRRTRNPEEQGDYFLDVGGVYDPAQGRFDHHQRDFCLTRWPSNVAYATAGLVWREFRISPRVKELVDKWLIQPVDAHDVGYKLPPAPGVISISSAISAMNPCWNSASNGDAEFKNAVDFAKLILMQTIKRAEAEERAEEIVGDAVEVFPGILTLHQFAPWQGKIPEHINLVVFPDKTNGWRVQAVQDKGRNMRTPLPKEWRGLSPVELQEMRGIKDAIFCHPSGFIAGAGSRDSCVEMAKLAIEAAAYAKAEDARNA